MSQENHHIYIVVLAAGVSSRLGQPKQLLKWQGVPLVSRMIAEASRVPHASPLVVTGASRIGVVESLIGHKYTEVYNPDYLKGIGTSIRAAVSTCRALAIAKQNFKKRQAILFVACDQIFVTHLVFIKMIEAYLQDPEVDVTICDYGKDLGLPAMISPCLWEDLGLLGDEEGAKQIWKSSSITRQTISCPQALWDIDTQEDCHRFGISGATL